MVIVPTNFDYQPLNPFNIPSLPSLGLPGPVDMQPGAGHGGVLGHDGAPHAVQAMKTFPASGACQQGLVTWGFGPLPLLDKTY